MIVLESSYASGPKMNIEISTLFSKSRLNHATFYTSTQAQIITKVI